MTTKGRSKERLNNLIKSEITKMFEQILDYTQIACSNETTFSVLRSRILRAGNDCIRRLHSGIDSYKVDYTVESEDVVEVIKRK